MGGLADGSIGLRLSKPGFDANANPPVAANLIFDSQWPQLLPIHQTGIVAIGGNAGNLTTNFPALGYIPLFSYLLKADGGKWQSNASYASQPYHNSQSVQGPVSFIQVWATSSQLGVYTYFGSGSWPSNFQVAYVIYKVASG